MTKNSALDEFVHNEKREGKKKKRERETSLTFKDREETRTIFVTGEIHPFILQLLSVQNNWAEQEWAPTIL